MSERSSRRSNLDAVFSDDIETICAQVGFDPSLYVEFPRQTKPFAPAEPELPPAPRPEAPAPPPSVTATVPIAAPPVSTAPVPPAPQPAPPPRWEARPPEARRPVASSLPQPQVYASRESPAPMPQPVYVSQPRPMAVPAPAPQPLPPPDAMPTPRQVAVQGVRAGLRALLDELGADGDKDKTEEPRPRRRARAVVVVPAIGGMGCTTLTATLARHYRSRGEAVLIFDDREDGLLRLHFRAADSVGIPILGRESATTLAVTWFAEPMNRYQIDYQWYLMDTKAISPALVNVGLAPGSCYLVPVLADMRGVRAAMRLSEQLDSYEGEQGRRLNFYFVLNQFDRASNLQEEMRQHLMRKLGGRLCPVAIRWSEEIGSALAEGSTVLDYAPESAAAQDFQSLGEWLAGLG
jgi:cellulose biosynthesis protein BcsQ